jgi:Zn-finger nucleic acid-binding protein
MIDAHEIDECPKCQGTWFDRDALRKVKDQTDPDLNWMDFELWKHPDRFQVEVLAAKCPKCALEMAVIDYDKTGVTVEYCTRCRGFWLDAGKFEKIIDALTLELETKSTSEYIKESLQEAKEIILGPEDMISEWRDFLTVVRMLHYRILVDNPKLQKALLDIQQSLPK